MINEANANKVAGGESDSDTEEEFQDFLDSKFIIFKKYRSRGRN